MIKKRSPLLAGVLSVLALGLGHMYCGEIRRGFVLLVGTYLLVLVGGFFGVFSTFIGFFLMLAFIFFAHLFCIVDSVKIAMKSGGFTLKFYNRSYFYFIAAVVILLCSNALLSMRSSILGYETYKIPAESMSPTLQAGDSIIVDTRTSNFKVGDVVVYRSVEGGGGSYVKRIAAMGNDMISIKNGKVILNGKEENALSVSADRRQQEMSILMEERKVPDGEVFLLGDWRDNSRDSRSLGTLPIGDVIGKVTYIFFSKDSGRIGKAVN